MPKVVLASLGHEELRRHVCVMCMRKADQSLSGMVLERVKKIFVSNLDLNDSRLPSGICATCRNLLQKISLGGSSKKVPDVFDFSSIHVRKVTKSNPVCDCLICSIAKCKGSWDHPLSKGKRERGRPASEGGEDSSFLGAPPTPVKICPSCLTLPKPGHPHQCKPSTRRENLLVLAKADPVGAQMIASEVVRESPASPGGTIRLAQKLGGRPMPIKPGAARKIDEKLISFSVQDLVQIQLASGLSNNKIP